MSNPTSINSPFRVPSPKLELPTVSDQGSSTNTSIKQDAKQTKQGVSELGDAIKDTFQKADKNTDDIKGKGKETGAHLSEVKDDLSNAASSARATVEATVKGIENVADRGAENGAQLRDGVNQAGTGLFHTVKRPVVWVANKVSDLGANLTRPRTGELNPTLGAALALGGTALFTAAAAASWSATLFINLPYLALGTALVGGTMLASTLLGRLFRAPAAASTAEGKVATGQYAHNTMLQMNQICEDTLAKLKADRKTVISKREKLVSRQESISYQTAELATRELELQKEIDILESAKVNPADAVTIEKATPVDAKALPAIHAAKVKAVVTTSDTEEKLQANVVEGLHVESSKTVQAETKTETEIKAA